MLFVYVSPSALVFSQLCKLTGGLLTEDQCWDFVASHMLPHALTSDASPRSLQSSTSGANFLSLLGEHAHVLPQHKVQCYIKINVGMFTSHSLFTMQFIMAS